MFSAAGISGRTLVTETFLSGTNKTWTAPSTTKSILSAKGYGARGEDPSTIYKYSKKTTTNKLRRSDGALITFQNGTTTVYGYPIPWSYCDELIYTPNDPTYESQRTCYEITDTTTSYPASTGEAASAFGLYFPGSRGNVAQSFSEYSNVAITPNGQYQITVPTNGILIISYYK